MAALGKAKVFVMDNKLLLWGLAGVATFLLLPKTKAPASAPEASPGAAGASAHEAFPGAAAQSEQLNGVFIMLKMGVISEASAIAQISAFPWADPGFGAQIVSAWKLQGKIPSGATVMDNREQVHRVYVRGHFRGGQSILSVYAGK